MNKEEKINETIIKARQRLREEFTKAQKTLPDTTKQLDDYLESLMLK
jgi:hypothetical protein